MNLRFIGSAIVPLALLLIGCKSDSEKARLLLNEAHTLIRQEKPDQAKRKLDELVAKFGHTKEATEANQVLTTLKIGEDLAEAKVDETWRNAILTALGTFMLDVGRFPTEQEGLKVLLKGKAIPSGMDRTGSRRVSPSSIVLRINRTE